MPDTSPVIPRHVGFILDGNRRWAKAKGLPTLEGHRQGAERFKEMSLMTFEKGVKYISAYVFSSENWSRAEEEVGYLMNLVVTATEKYLDIFHQAGIKIVILGRREGLNEKVLKSLKATIKKTKANTNGTIALCFNYGGKEEIVDAANQAITSGEQLTVESLRSHLYEPQIPDIDLLIRTSGEKRISGYMLWRSAYSELYFTDKMWPDFQEKDLDEALNWYKDRNRRFGQ